MQTRRLGALCGLLLCGILGAGDVCAQGPRGVGGDIKVAKPKRVKKKKLKKTPPIQKIPKSAPWWQGGGPGPIGAGVK